MNIQNHLPQPHPLPQSKIKVQSTNRTIPSSSLTNSLLLPFGHSHLPLVSPAGNRLATSFLAARLTTNSLPPPHPSQPRASTLPLDDRTRDHHPGTIIYLSTEDSFQTLDARLTAAGADPDFTLCPRRKLPLHYHDENTEHPQFPEALKRGILPPPLIRYLAATIDDLPNPRLLILDPLPSFLGLKDSSNAALIRRLLEPLLDLAQCLAPPLSSSLSHLSKSGPPPAPHLLRSLGSIAVSYPSSRPSPSSSWNTTPTTPPAALPPPTKKTSCRAPPLPRLHHHRTQPNRKSKLENRK